MPGSSVLRFLLLLHPGPSIPEEESLGSSGDLEEHLRGLGAPQAIIELQLHVATLPEPL